MKDGLVRADTLPLVFRALGTETLPRGARVRVRLNGCDLLTLDLHANLLARIDDQAPAPADAETEEDGEGTEASGPLALAIDVDDSPADAGAGVPSPAADP
jgi:exoribonuclease-2